jgi:hypothetical protein
MCAGIKDRCAEIARRMSKGDGLASAADQIERLAATRVATAP